MSDEKAEAEGQVISIDVSGPTINSSSSDDYADENDIKDTWQVFTAADALIDRPPIEYAVQGIIPMPSLIVPFGAPGSLKSFIIADMCICIAAGIPWLAPVNVDLGGKAVTNAMPEIPVKHIPVMWVDFDNGERKTHDRFKVLIKGHQIENLDDMLFSYYSMPWPTLDVSDPIHMSALKLRVKRNGSRVLVLDNLAMVSGDNDENSVVMKNVMFNLRRLSEELQLAVIVIHHERKDSRPGARAGESLRGSSSIEGAIDLALLVKRADVSSREIMMRSTKTRGDDVVPFAATFTFEKNEDGETIKALFYRTPVDNSMVMDKEEARKINNDTTLRTTIVQVLQKAEMNHRSPNTEEIIKEVQDKLANDRKVSKGEKAICAALDQMEADERIKYDNGGKNSKFWRLLRTPDDLANN